MRLSLLLFGPLVLFGTGGAPSAQYATAPTTYAFVDIAATGTPLVGLAGLNQGGSAVPIGMSFHFYGSAATSVSACVDGYLTYGSDLTDFTPDCPAPSLLNPNGLIAPFWDDLSFVGGGALYRELQGTAPARSLIVQWEDVATFESSVASLTFQVQLFEADNSIEFHYQSLDDPSGAFPVGADEAFIGIENPEGDQASTLTCNAGVPFLSAGDAFRFELDLPFVQPPATVAPGAPFFVRGFADPTSVFVFAWSRTPGPTGPIPLLENLSLDLGLPLFVAGLGVTPTGGGVLSNALVVPAGLSGVTFHTQLLSLASVGPIAGVKVSNAATTTAL